MTIKFRIERSVDGGATWDQIESAIEYDVVANHTYSYIDTDELTLGQEYTYRVREEEPEVGDWSEEVSITTIDVFVPNYITLVYDTDVIPLEYEGEQYAYAQSPWVVHQGYLPNQWHVDHMKNIYFADDDGYVYKYGIEKALDNVYYVTPTIDLNIPDRKKRVRWIDLNAISYGDVGIRVLYRTDKDVDDDEAWSVLCDYIVENNEYPFIKMYDKPLFRKIQLKFELLDDFNGYFVLNSFTLDMAVRAQRRELI